MKQSLGHQSRSLGMVEMTGERTAGRLEIARCRSSLTHRVVMTSLTHRVAINAILALMFVCLTTQFASTANAQANQPTAIEQGLRDMLLKSTSAQPDPNSLPSSATADGNQSLAGSTQNFLLSGPEKWTSREGLSSSLQIVLLLTIISLAPAILLMTTCYVRIIVVFGLLRQALGTGQLPPSQVVTSIALFMTMFVMAPVWNKVYTQAIAPYTASGSQMGLEEAWTRGVEPVRTFMSDQIDMAGNHDDVYLFYKYYAPDAQPPQFFDDVPLRVLLPAYMLSELKTSFLMGFQIFLPFLLIDLVVAAITISMGMMMLPPAMISLPFKLLLFVLIDGWHLVVEMLLASFGTVK